MSSNQLPSQYQSYIHLSRYSRWIENENRRETWPETVARYCDFFRDKHGDIFPYQVVYDAILNLEVMPSMRSLMTAGPALRKDNIAGYNCSFIAVDDIRAFDEILYILMNGTGVGFSVERQHIAKLPAIGLSVKDGKAILADSMTETDEVIVVEDSKEGWADAFRRIVAELYSARIPKWDTSKVRPAGTRLKTFGGRASGPKPLIDLFKFTVSLFKNAVGRRLTSVECHDLVCKIADIVVVGGVRRSALISLSNLSDDRMRSAKTGQWWVNDPHRALANNSAVYTERPSAEIFMQEWLSLIESKAGERGIFSLASAHKKGAENGRRKAELIAGTNPCFKRGTLIHTSEGTFPIEELIGRVVKVWDGNRYVEIDNFRVTAEDQPVVTLTLHDGSEVTATPYHRFVLADGTVRELKDLEVGDALMISNAPVSGGKDADGAYIKGFMIGDGTSNGTNPILYLYGDKVVCADRLLASASELPVADVKGNYLVEQLSFPEVETYGRRRMIGLTPRREALMPWATSYKKGLPTEVFSWSVKSKADFISGLLDSDGTALDTKNGYGYQITNVSRELLADVQMLLKSLNVQSTLRLSKEAGQKDFGDKGGVCEIKALYRLTISQAGAIALSQFISTARVKSFSDRTLTYNMKPRFNKIAAIEEAGVEDEVFCCTVPTNSQVALGASIITSQCGEILLRSAGFCNLTEVIVRAEDTLDDLKRKAGIATVMGTFQAAMTDFKYVRDIWRQNAEEERLLGVSMTGIMDHPFLSTTACGEVLKEVRDHTVKVNKIWAGLLGINQSAAITTVKPSGCTTLDTEIKTATGSLSMEALFTQNGYGQDELKSLPEKSWLEPKIETFVLDDANQQQRVTKLYVNGQQSVFTVTFEDGNSYRFTGNHMLKTVDGWKRVDELTDADDVIAFA